MKQLYVKTRDEWRQWLSKHHKTEREVWLVFFKKETGKPSIEYDCSVEEALCFGWVDSIIKKLDDEKYARKFTPRKSESPWSESNKTRVKKMIELGPHDRVRSRQSARGKTEWALVQVYPTEYFV